MLSNDRDFASQQLLHNVFYRPNVVQASEILPAQDECALVYALHRQRGQGPVVAGEPKGAHDRGALTMLNTLQPRAA